MRCAFPIFRVLLLAGLLAPVAAAASAEEAASDEFPAVVAEVMGEEVESGKLLLERAEAYWKARIAQDNAVYGFYPPEDKRPEGMKGVAAEGGTIGWSDYAIEAVKAEGDEGLVQVRTHMRLPMEQASRFPEAMKKYLTPTVMERWVRVEGVWYKRPVEMGLSRMMKAGREDAKKQAEAAKSAEKAKTAEAKPAVE